MVRSCFFVGENSSDGFCAVVILPAFYLVYCTVSLYEPKAHQRVEIFVSVPISFLLTLHVSFLTVCILAIILKDSRQ